MGRYDNYQKKLFGDFNIIPEWKVLDIGSGNDPFPLATHLADLYIEDNSHRTDRPLKEDNKQVVECNVENMDCFEDKSMDFIFCSHLFEHLDNPDKACKEIIRVGKRGYIETPSRINEIMFGSLEHRWIIENWNNVLTFQKMTRREKKHSFGDIFSRLFDVDFKGRPKTSLQKIAWKLDKIFKKNPQLFYTMFCWEKEFKWQII